MEIRGRLADAGLVLAVTAVTLASGAQAWTGMNSPDSEFSASLVVFGNEVTERAIEPAYYWTRLGFLAPMRGLTALMGFWTAWEVWRALLLLLTIACVFWIARRRTGRLVATGAALLVALNTMLLAYLGNPYATGTAMAVTFLLLASAVATLDPPGGRVTRWVPGAVAGGSVAWLAMTNPYAALLGLVLWAGVRIIALTNPERRWRRLTRDMAAAVITGIVVFGAFLAAGAAIFPGENWLATYRDWNARLDYASFISDLDIWSRDAALGVMLIALGVALIALIARRSRWTTSALVIIGLTIAFAWGYLQLVPGPWLEAPHYAAMLWPPALVAITMAIAAIAHSSRSSALAWLALVPLIGLLIWAGHRGDQVSAAQVCIAIGASLAMTVITSIASRRKSSSQTLIALLAIVSLAVIGLSAQVLQNGRGQLGIYGQYPMNAAFVDYDAKLLMRSKVQAQEWLIANTSPDDRIGIWTDLDRRTSALAGMQLWGKYNNVTANAVLDRSEITGLEGLRPSVIAMYAPDRAQIDAFAASLPPTARPEPTRCTTVPYLGIGSPEAHLCLVRLRWVG